MIIFPHVTSVSTWSDFAKVLPLLSFSKLLMLLLILFFTHSFLGYDSFEQRSPERLQVDPHATPQIRSPNSPNAHQVSTCSSDSTIQSPVFTSTPINGSFIETPKRSPSARNFPKPSLPMNPPAAQRRPVNQRSLSHQGYPNNNQGYYYQPQESFSSTSTITQNHNYYQFREEKKEKFSIKKLLESLEKNKKNMR